VASFSVSGYVLVDYGGESVKWGGASVLGQVSEPRATTEITQSKFDYTETLTELSTRNFGVGLFDFCSGQYSLVNQLSGKTPTPSYHFFSEPCRSAACVILEEKESR
jgi:hypothetical protein